MYPDFPTGSVETNNMNGIFFFLSIGHALSYKDEKASSIVIKTFLFFFGSLNSMLKVEGS